MTLCKITLSHKVFTQLFVSCRCMCVWHCVCVRMNECVCVCACVRACVRVTMPDCAGLIYDRYCFDTTKGAWHRLDDIPAPTSVHSCCGDEGRIYILGGFNSVNELDAVYSAWVRCCCRRRALLAAIPCCAEIHRTCCVMLQTPRARTHTRTCPPPILSTPPSCTLPLPKHCSNRAGHLALAWQWPPVSDECALACWCSLCYG